jgi:hypothetical protein
MSTCECESRPSVAASQLSEGAAGFFEEQPEKWPGVSTNERADVLAVQWGVFNHSHLRVGLPSAVRRRHITPRNSHNEKKKLLASWPDSRRNLCLNFKLSIGRWPTPRVLLYCIVLYCGWAGFFLARASPPARHCRRNHTHGHMVHPGQTPEHPRHHWGAYEFPVRCIAAPS